MAAELDSPGFGEWLRRRRKGLGLTQAELARKVGCATITIQKIEADERRPSRDMAGWLAEACGIPSSERERFLRLARRTAAHPAREQAALDRRPTNLPLALPPLVGREREMKAVRERILASGVRLVTITGPPGVGKTTLALHASVEMLAAFEDGATFVSLAGASDRQSVAAAIARALDVNEAGAPAPRRLKEYLSGKQLLLVLDNFEQALDGASLVSDMLAACPWLTVLATSRSALDIRPERRLLLGPLALPGDPSSFTRDDVAQFPAVLLFVQRARDANPEFALTAGNAAPVASICARLGGLPLAIELAASQASVLTPEQLLERLAGSVVLDGGGLRDLPDRHRTLRAAIDWSCQLLSEPQRIALARLGVFSGQFTLEAAEAVLCAVACGGSRQGTGPPSAVEHLVSLVNGSLVMRRNQGGDSRMHLLEPIREYALNMLDTISDEEDARRRHAKHYLSMALEADGHLRGAGQEGWLARLENDRQNLQAALEFLFDIRDVESALRLAGALFWFWNIRGHLSEGRSALARGLEAAVANRAPASIRARTLCQLAVLEWQEGNLRSAHETIDRSLALLAEGPPCRDVAFARCTQAMIAVFQEQHETAIGAATESMRTFGDLGDTWGVALAMNPMGKVHLQQHDVQAARAEFERSLSLFRECGDNWGAGIPLMNLGVLEKVDRHPRQARARLEEAVDMFERVGERWMRAMVLDALATLLHADGETARAADARRESLDLFARMGLNVSRARVLGNFARVLESHADYEQALGMYEESLGLLLQQAVPLETARCLIGLAAASAGCGDARRAARALGAVERVLESSGKTLPPEDRADRDRTLLAIRAVLEDESFYAEWQGGRDLDVEHCLDPHG